MPTTYTHYAFGQEVICLLSKDLQKLIRPYIKYYNIGLHGPDILFYYRAFSKNAVNQYGVYIHDKPMSDFLHHAFDVYEKQKNKKEAFAYLAGFMTHYILDSACHPYIRKRIKETGISHAEIETDWDYLMMKKKRRNPLHYKVACHIKNSRKISRIIAPYYDKQPKHIQKTLWYMKLILNHIFHSHFGFKQTTAAFINKNFLPEMSFQHYFRKKKINVQNTRTCSQLNQLYRQSAEPCAQMIAEMYRALQEGDRTFCDKKRLQRVFS